METGIGVLGVGSLTESVVKGLRRGGYTGPIMLSPRNADRSAALAENFGCQVMPDNQAVVEAARTVILGVRPADVATVAQALSLTEEHRVISLVAGLELAALNNLFAPAQSVRVMLSVASEINATTVALCPPAEWAQTLLAPLGNIFPLAHEEQLDVATVGACMNGWFYYFLQTLQDWYEQQGLSSEQARLVVTSSMKDCLAYAGQQSAQTFKTIGDSIATPGTYTALGVDELVKGGALDAWPDVCTRTLAALRERMS
ncbi:pyrroline-5-carboxylate reductase [Pseudomonas duriflava]|uniref:Pyrroline-5-carboxylate reductase n=1 Tax=Pseudomonas duriflava TaxID=459528 RepID=A0A562QE87_9PSED|nr:NAD(P)-binding domain-containing protein [Pseudomonas duriflava]TWI55013.1 pyrroline-5-carboxylate reductase [Pseudomonas duriflava]